MATERDGRDPDAAAAPLGGGPQTRRGTAHVTLALASQRVRSSVLRLPPTVHGDGDHGFMASLVGVACDKGVSGYIGDGSNRWPAVHRLDAAHLVRLALEQAPAGSVLHAVADEGVPIRAIAEVIGRHLNLPLRGGDLIEDMRASHPPGSALGTPRQGAVRVAAPGATLVLRAGTHRLSHPLEIDQPLSLVGDGRESTHVVCASPASVVWVGGNGRFAASDVTFTHEGAQGANVVEVAWREIDLRHCGFFGGTLDKAVQSGGVGLLLRGQVRGTVAKCEASRNGHHGICVREQAQPVLECPNGCPCRAHPVA